MRENRRGEDPPQCGHPWHKHGKLESPRSDDDNPNTERTSSMIGVRFERNLRVSRQIQRQIHRPEVRSVFGESACISVFARAHKHQCSLMENKKKKKERNAKRFSSSSSTIDVNVTEK